MRLTTRSALITAAVAATIALSAAAAGASPIYPSHIYGTPGTGCPSGAVCIYPTNDDFRTGPDHTYWSYGPHNLHHELGGHLVYNNQYSVGGAIAGVSFCLGYDGSGGTYNGGLYGISRYTVVDLTPVNSINLWLQVNGYANRFECTL